MDYRPIFTFHKPTEELVGLLHRQSHISTGKKWLKLGIDFHVDDHSGKCFENLMMRFARLFINAGKVYAAVHLVLFVLRLRKSKKGDRKKLLLQTFTGWLKSCLFASNFALSIPFCRCFINRMWGPGNSWTGFLISFLFSWAIFFESSSRWGEMSIWVLAQWFESKKISFVDKRKLLPFIPHFEVSEPIIIRKYYLQSPLGS